MMRIFAVETSCDETAAAVVEDGTIVRSNVIASAAKDLEPFGGVFPEVAARRQVEYIVPVVTKALTDALCSVRDIQAIAVTSGPGLLTSLLVGVMAARALAWAWRKPLIGIHHTLGHLASPWLECTEEIPFPVLTLSVSGGHTDLWLRESHTRGILLGRTLDDAAGEAFDKGATLLGLPYPGGPALALLAEGGDLHAVAFPRPLLGKDARNFSFAGLKTALKYMLRDAGGLAALSDAQMRNIAASYQEAICLHLVSRIEEALKTHDVDEVHIVGGVSANKRLRALLQEHLSMTTSQTQIRARAPAHFAYCTDNAAMIAAAAEFLVRERGEGAFAPFETTASLRLSLC